MQPASTRKDVRVATGGWLDVFMAIVLPLTTQAQRWRAGGAAIAAGVPIRNRDSLQGKVRPCKSQIHFLCHRNKMMTAPSASKASTAGSGTTEPEKEKLICSVFEKTVQGSMSLALDAHPIGHR